MREHLVAFVLTVCVGHALPLLAQEAADTVRLEPVVVTANRVPVARDAVVASVTVLNGAKLRERGISTVAEALRGVPGLTVAQSGSMGSLTSVFIRGGESDYVKVLVDGVPMNDPGGAFNFAHLTTDNVERIEVVRGPASVLYGSDAVAGVIQIFTRRGSGAPRGNVAVRGGNFGSAVGSAGLSGGGERVDYALSFSLSTTNGVQSFNSDYDNTVLSGRMHVVPDARTDAVISVRYTDAKFHFPTDFAGRVVDRNAFSLYDQLAGAVDIGRYLGPRVEARLQLALHELDTGLDDRQDGAADTLMFFATQSLQNVSRRSADLRFNIMGPSGTIVTVGVQLEDQKMRSINESQSEFGVTAGSMDLSRSSRGYYLQLHAEPAARLALTAGVRLDDSDTFGMFVTYRAGATYRPTPSTRVRASLGRAFREPDFFENLADIPFSRGNPDLEPERTTTWEAGIEQTLLGGVAEVAATYFDQRFRDLIQFTFAPASPADPNYFNVAAADARGVELSTRARVAGVTVGATYTWLETTVRDAGFDVGAGAVFVEGERLLRRPTSSVTVNVAYRLLDRASLSVDLRHVGNRDDRDFAPFPAEPVVLSEFTTVGVAADVDVYRSPSGYPAISAVGRVENMLGERYEEVFGFPAVGRWIRGGVRVRF